MAVIFDPHGPLSLPCENTTVPDDLVITPQAKKHRFAAADAAAVQQSAAVRAKTPGRELVG
jgi:hypothetical protein